MINFQKQIARIQSDRTLRFYGIALGFTHILTFLYWNQNSFFITSQSGINAEPLCFPFFSQCDLFRQNLSPENWGIILYTYLAFALFTTLSFCFTRLTKIGFHLLIFTTLFKLFLHLSNYNFMGNYHYMIALITAVYLFATHKKTTIRYFLVSFYIAAGLLKLNIDWLSGAAMLRTPYIGGQQLIILLFYVVLLEVVLSLLLLHKNKWVQIFALLQFGIFHIFSWYIVGFFYPTIMFCLLSIFFLEVWQKKSDSNELLDFVSGRAPRQSYVFIGAFWMLQALPFLMSADPALSGTGRLSSLNMFDSKTQCHSLLLAETNEGSVHLPNNMKNLGARLRCDPLVLLNQAQQICRENKNSQEIKKLNVALFSKRTTQQKFIKVLDIKDICRWKRPLWAELFAKGDQ